MDNSYLLVDPLLFDTEDYDDYVEALLDNDAERRELIERKYRD